MARWLAPVPLVLTACADEPTCVDLRPYPNIHNHVMPLAVALDPDRRKVYSTSIANPNLAQVDLDDVAMERTWPLAANPTKLAQLLVDETGVLYMTAPTRPSAHRIDPSTGDYDRNADVLEAVFAAIPRPGGGAVLGGRLDGSGALVLVDADGTPGEPRALDEDPTALLWLEDGPLGVLTAQGQLYELDLSLPLEEVEPIERCTVPFPATKAAQLGDGTIVVIREDAIGTAGCDGDEPASWIVGVENKSIAVLDEHRALVLDRIGSDEGADPNLGLAREVTADGPTGAAFTTGKNTGWGAIDPETGWLWANSEGTTELMAFDPDSGDVMARVRTGTFVDGLATLPGDSAYYATGRLSDLVARIDTPRDALVTHEVHWPYSPVPDLERGMLWVVSQTDGVVFGLDANDLSTRRQIELGTGSNALLTFDTLLLHPDRGTLFAADSEDDVLIELDVDAGLVSGRWDLGGPRLTDPDQIGEVQLLLAPDGAVLVVRTNDGRVQRLEPAAGRLVTAFLDEGALQALDDDDAVGLAQVDSEGGLLYVAGAAMDLVTLQRRVDSDRRVSRMLAPSPLNQGEWIAVDKDRMHFLSLDEDGEAIGSLGFAAADLNALVFALDSGGRALATRSNQGLVCRYDLRRLD